MNLYILWVPVQEEEHLNLSLSLFLSLTHHLSIFVTGPNPLTKITPLYVMHERTNRYTVLLKLEPPLTLLANANAT